MFDQNDTFAKPPFEDTATTGTGTGKRTLRETGSEAAEMKSVRVDNLGCSASISTIASYFKLDEVTCTYSIDCRINDEGGDNKYFAIITLPGELADILIQSDGTTFNGRVIKISIVNDSEDDPGHISYAAAAVAAETTVERKIVEIDMRQFHSPYAVRDLTTSSIAQAVSRSFTFDDTKKLVQISRDKSLFKIDTKHPELYETVETLQHLGKEIGKVTVKVEKQIVTENGRVITKRFRENDELLVTLNNANTTEFEDVSEDDIYEKIVNTGVGTIKIGLSVQKYQESELPNGNLYIVLKGVKPEDKDRLPYYFSFGHRRMYLRFKGRQRACSFCHQPHGGVCEREQKIRMMEKERDRVKEENGGNFLLKTFSNSTLRYANEKSLACNVDAMPGGSTGNVLNAVEIDQEAKDIPNVLLVLGQSDVDSRSSTEEFLWSLNRSTERIQALSQSKNIAIMPHPLPKNLFDSECQVREEVFREKLKLLDDLEKVQVWENPLEQYDEDNGSHPSKEQTAGLLLHLNERSMESFGTRLTLFSSPDDALFSNRFYVGVNALYKYGCSACCRKERNTWVGLCNECKNDMREDSGFKATLDTFRQRVNDVQSENLPLLNHSGDDPATKKRRYNDAGRRTMSKGVPQKSLSS